MLSKRILLLVVLNLFCLFFCTGCDLCDWCCCCGGGEKKKDNVTEKKTLIKKKKRRKD